MVSELSDGHMLILSLAQACFEAEDSPRWRHDTLDAAEIHGEACNALWHELKKQVRLQGGTDLKMMRYPTRAEMVSAFRKEMLKSLKDRLPDLMEAAIGDLE